MATVTIENSWESNDADMGESHTEIHKNQHNWLQENEPLYETIIGDTTKSGHELALEMAQKIGVKKPEEWKLYNAGLRKARRKKSYSDYVASLAGNFIKGKERTLNNENLPVSKHQKIERELKAIRRNKDIPSYSSLFYVGSVEDYEGKTAEQIKKLRKAKADVLRMYFKSKQFKQFHPQMYRLEIHYDERGELHGQGQETFYNQRKSGRVEVSQRAVLKKQLVEHFGSEDEFNRRLKTLCYAHDKVKSKNNKGAFRADTWYLAYLDKEHEPDLAKHKFSKSDLNSRIPELARIEEIIYIRELAKNIYPKYGFNWSDEVRYTTNGHHQTAPQYVNSLYKKQAKTAKKQADKAKSKLNEVNKNLSASKTKLKTLYKDTVGSQPFDEDGNELSPKDMLKGVTSALNELKQDISVTTNEKEQLKKETSSLRTTRDEEKRKLDKIRLQRRQALQRKETLTAEVEKLTVKRDVLSTNVSNLKQETEKWNKFRDDAKKDYQHWNDLLETLKKNITKYIEKILTQIKKRAKIELDGLYSEERTKHNFDRINHVENFWKRTTQSGYVYDDKQHGHKLVDAVNDMAQKDMKQDKIEKETSKESKDNHDSLSF